MPQGISLRNRREYQIRGRSMESKKNWLLAFALASSALLSTNAVAASCCNRTDSCCNTTPACCKDPVPVPLVSVPCFAGNWGFTIEGMLLRVSNNNMWYVKESTLDFSQTGDEFMTHSTTDYGQKFKFIQPQYRGGFRLAASYAFANSSNDIQLAWTYFDNNFKKNIIVQNNSAFTSPIGNYAIVGLRGNVGNEGDYTVLQPLAGAESTKIKYDAVDLDWGQYINIGCRSKFRLFGGLRYAYLSSSMVLDAETIGQKFNIENALLEDIDAVTTETVASKFTGIGPRFGMDVAYPLFCGFGLVGNFAGALLAGKSTPHSGAHYIVTLTSQEIGRPSGDGVGVINYGTTSLTRVIPALDTKLGLTYAGKFSSLVVGLELGYKFIYYANAADRLRADTQALSNGSSNQSIPFVATALEPDDLSFQGPYLALNIRC